MMTGMLGYLVYLLGYLPKAFGVLCIFAALCLFTSVATAFFAPAINAAISPAIVVPLFLTRLSFALWLALMGVNVLRWPFERFRGLPLLQPSNRDSMQFRRIKEI